MLGGWDQCIVYVHHSGQKELGRLHYNLIWGALLLGRQASKTLLPPLPRRPSCCNGLGQSGLTQGCALGPAPRSSAVMPFHAYIISTMQDESRWFSLRMPFGRGSCILSFRLHPLELLALSKRSTEVFTSRLLEELGIKLPHSAITNYYENTQTIQFINKEISKLQNNLKKTSISTNSNPKGTRYRAELYETTSERVGEVYGAAWNGEAKSERNHYGLTGWRDGVTHGQGVSMIKVTI